MNITNFGRKKTRHNFQNDFAMQINKVFKVGYICLICHIHCASRSTKLDKLLCVGVNNFQSLISLFWLYCHKKYKLWRTPNVHVKCQRTKDWVPPMYTRSFILIKFMYMHVHVFLEILPNYIDIYRNLHNLAL